MVQPITADSAAHHVMTNSGMAWCEARYSPKGPEYINSISSVALCIAAWRLLRATRYVPRDTILYVFLIGIGSASFHYRPLNLTRLLDEVPIILMGNSIVSHARILPPHVRQFLLGALLATCILAPALTCLVLLGGAWVLFTTQSCAIPDRMAVSKHTRFFAFMSTICWLADFGICPVAVIGDGWIITYHAIWHLSAGILAYHGILDLVGKDRPGPG